MRFVAPGQVLLSRPSALDDSVWTRIYEEAYDVLHNATDAKGRKLQITEITEADMNNIGLGKKELEAINAGEEDAPALTYVQLLARQWRCHFPSVWR